MSHRADTHRKSIQCFAPHRIDRRNPQRRDRFLDNRADNPERGSPGFG
jgi:hypothetical protein